MEYIDPAESAVKAALDHAELVEREPALQCAEINLNSDGGPMLVLPRHPLVIAFLRELDGLDLRERDDTKWRQPIDPDLKTARRKFRIAANSYQTRVVFRCGLAGTPAKPTEKLRRMMCLSAILIDRAEAKFWRKTATYLEHIENVRNSNKKNIERNKRHRAGLRIGAAIKGAINEQR